MPGPLSNRVLSRKSISNNRIKIFTKINFWCRQYCRLCDHDFASVHIEKSKTFTLSYIVL